MELAHCLPVLMTIEAYDAARARARPARSPAARSAGAFGLLAYCLGAQAELDARIGHWASAYADGFEAVDLAREAGQIGQLSYNLARLAWVEAAQGREEACRAHAEEALELAAALRLQLLDAVRRARARAARARARRSPRPPSTASARGCGAADLGRREPNRIDLAART